MTGGAALPHLLGWYGYAALFAAVALESCGVPVPGEVTLVLAAVDAGARPRQAPGGPGPARHVRSGPPRRTYSSGAGQMRRSAPAVPTAVTLAVGCLALVPATFVLDLFDVQTTVAVGVLAAVATIGSVRATLPAAAFLGMVGFALFNGFVEDTEGVLRFHGMPDGVRLGLLVLLPVLVAAASRAGSRRVRGGQPV